MEAVPSFLHQTSSSENFIKMHEKWLARIGTQTSVFTEAFNACPEPFTDCLATFLSLYLTNALSTLHDRYWEEDEDRLRIHVEVYTHLYAYSFQDSVSIPVAMIVLLLQFIVAFSHLGVIFSPRPWTSSGWGSSGQLLALAAQLGALGELRDVEAGVESSHTWRKVVSVQEVVDENRLEMVFGAPGNEMEEGDVKGRKTLQSVKPKIKYN